MRHAGGRGRAGRLARSVTGPTGRATALVLTVVLVASGCLFHPGDGSGPQAVAARQQVNDLLDGDDAAGAAALECTLFGCEAPLGTTTVAMDPTLAGGFFSAPWPSDTRLAADGSLDLAGFPGRDTTPIADLVLGRGEAATFGYGTNSAVYFQATGPVDRMTLPLTPELSNRPRSNAMLLDLDHPGAPPVPLIAEVSATATPRRPADLIALLPYPGHPLTPSTRYAAVVFDGVRDTDGNRLAPAPAIDQLDGPAPVGVAPATWTQLRQDRDDAIAAVRAHTLWHPTELVAFTAFTTQDTTGEMAAIAAAVDALPAPQLLERTADPNPCAPGGTSRTSGRVALPIWQEGTRPYLDAGGGIVVGPGGLAVQQGVELGADGLGVRFDMAVPCGPAPAAGWPILVWMDGTGGSAHATGISQLGSNLPYAVVSVAPMYSSDRLVDVAPPWNAPELQFFNYLNPLAARTNLLQQAADTLYVKRIAQNLTLEPGEAGSDRSTFDAGTVVLAGHSQGATSLPITLSVDPSVRGAFLSAGGAGLYHSILHRQDVRDLVDGLLGTEPGELDVFHPYPQVLQTFAEVGDNANHAAAIETDVVLYAGLRDGCTAIEVAAHLAQVMGVPMARPLTKRLLFGPDLPPQYSAYESPFEPATTDLPASGNLPGGRTAVMVQVDAGHFGASTYPTIGRSFVDSIAAGGPAVVDPGPTPAVAPGSSCPRFDPAPAAT